MSIKGFSVNGVVQRYDYTALDNLPQGQGVSDDLKAALLQLAQKVAYIDDQGQTYYDDLYDALYPEKTLLSITANFQQGQAVVYNTDSLDSLKQYLTVTAIYDDASTETVPSSAYTLTGTLTTGTSVITVTYEGKTDAFNVTVTAAPMSFTITNNLTGCTTSNSATAVLENTSYTAVITASSGYTLVGATVSITMGGNDITTSAYSGGIITINSVTGALVISVAAVGLNSISAVYTQSGTVYDTDTLDSLKADLEVTAHYSDSSTQTVPAADYTLSGTLTVGTSTITVAYGGKTTTFIATVTGWTWKYKASDGQTLTQRTDLFTVDTSNFAQTFTEEITDGYLRLFAGNNGGKKLWKFASAYPQTNNNAVMEMRIKYAQVAYAQEYSNLQIQLSDGTGGAKIGASRIGNKTGSPCFTTIIGTTITRAPTFELNSWHTIRIEIKNGLQSVYIDGESVVNNQQKCTSYCVYNRVFMQAPNIASTSTSSEVFIDYIAYKNYD